MSKIKVLFVCLGNICRSPLAEAIFNHKIKEKGLDTLFEADSCGTGNYHIGLQPDERTIRNALRNGVSITHLGRQLAHTDLASYDYVFAMDKSNHTNILRLDNAHNHAHKINLMREFDPEGSGEVPDPYYGTDKEFQEVFDILNRTIENFIRQIEVKHVRS